MNVKSELHHEMETIEAPEYLRKQIREKIEQEIRVGKKTPKKSRKLVYFTTIAAAAILITAGSGYKSPTMADVLSKVPVVGVIYEDVSADFGLKEAREKGLTQGYQQTVTDKDIEMTIKDVYYDGRAFSIGFRLVNHGKEVWGDDLKGIFSMDFDAKGFKLGQRMASTSMEKVGENVFEGVTIIEADRFKKEFVLELEVNEIDGKKGRWDFNIPVTSEFLQGSIHTFAPHYKTKALDAEITVKELTFTPSGIRLVTETLSEKGTGNRFGFTVKGVGVGGGGSSNFGSQHGKKGKDHIIHSVNLNPVAEIPDQLTITVYDLYNELNGTNYEFDFTVPLKMN
ncbi:DUF4179 domain-containing protein [Pseudoneobacillus sp. C159]